MSHIVTGNQETLVMDKVSLGSQLYSELCIYYKGTLPIRIVFGFQENEN